MTRFTGGLAVVAGMIGMLLGQVSAAFAKPINVVTSLATFASLAESVGGEHVTVSYVASPKFNPHFIEPKPSDVLKVKRADLWVHAGLDLELWRYPLADAAGNMEARPGGAKELDLSRGVPLLEVPDRAVTRAEGDIHLYGNPHYWLDPENAGIMARTLCDKLCAIDPSHEQAYRRNLDVFLGRLDRKMPEWTRRLAPYAGQELVGDHNAWPYLMQFAGLRMEQFLEPKPGIPPTPRQVEFLEAYVKAQGVRVIVQSTFMPAQASAALAKRTGVRVVTLAQNVGEVADATDYVSLIDYNVAQLEDALK